MFYSALSAIILALFLSVSTAGAETNEGLSRVQEEMERLKGQIKERKESVQEISRKERTVFDEFEKAGKALAEAQAEERGISARLRKVEAEIGQLNASVEQTKGEMASNEGVVAARLKAIYKHGRAGYFRSVFAADTQTSALRHYRYLNIVAAGDRDLLSGFNKLASDAQARYQELEKQKTELTALREESARKSAEVAKRLKEKKDILATVRKEKSSYEGMIKGMEESSIHLQTLLKQASQPVNVQPAPSAPPSAAPLSAPAPVVSMTARKETGEKQEMKAATLSDMKGKLPWPGNGELVGRFGRYHDPEKKTEAVRKGIEIAAPPDSDIVAVFPGKVIYSNWLKGYGKAVILDHGATYYTVYAHMSDTLVREGDRVDQGVVIGRVGDTGSLKGPDLYFEIRHGGEAEDPVLWLKRK